MKSARRWGVYAALCAAFVAPPAPRTFYGEADARERVLLSDGGGREKLSVVVVWDFTSRFKRAHTPSWYMTDGSRRQTLAGKARFTVWSEKQTAIASEMPKPADPPSTPTPAAPTLQMCSEGHTMM